MERIQKKPLPERPTSKGHLTLTRAVSIGSSCTAGVAIALGTFPDALAAGGANVALPIMLAGGVSFGLSAYWHKLLGYAAHAREGHERSIALGFGCAGALVGISLSGWFLAATIGGVPAETEYRLAYVDQLRMASDKVASNGAVEHNIIDALNTAAANVQATAEADASTGLLSKRRSVGAVVTTLRNAANGMAAMASTLSGQEQERARNLERGRDALDAAAHDAADNDATAFFEDVTRAAGDIRAAEKIRLGASSLNIGLVAPQVALSVIQGATAKVAMVISDVNERRRPVVIRDFQPVDTKTALLRDPQPLAILAAVIVELIPLGCLALLLTIWRDPENNDHDDNADAETVGPFERSRPRMVSTVAAE